MDKDRFQNMYSILFLTLFIGILFSIVNGNRFGAVFDNGYGGQGGYGNLPDIPVSQTGNEKQNIIPESGSGIEQPKDIPLDEFVNEISNSVPGFNSENEVSNTDSQFQNYYDNYYRVTETVYQDTIHTYKGYGHYGYGSTAYGSNSDGYGYGVDKTPLLVPYYLYHKSEQETLLSDILKLLNGVR